MTRPADLTPYPLTKALAALDGADGGVVIVTMSTGQWDRVLANFYEAHCLLLELDEVERPVRAYRKPDAAARERDAPLRNDGGAGAVRPLRNA